MIECLTIASVASYGSKPQVLERLAPINFIYGANAAGKTTISRVIANESNYPSCKVVWRNGARLQPMVYNQDFIERNFSHSTDLRGIFTLGEHRIETVERIAALKSEVDDMDIRIARLTWMLQGENGQGGKRGELAALEEDCKKKCWVQKRKYDDVFAGAFAGHVSSYDKFKAKVVAEWDKNAAGPLIPLPELKRRAESIFGKSHVPEQALPAVDMTALLRHQANPILRKKVIGKDDVDITAMIRTLENSDWVRAGRAFYNSNNGICPFCQQHTSTSFAQSLEDYFDASFIADSEAIDRLGEDYAAEAARVQGQIDAILNLSSRFLELDKLKAQKELLNAQIMINQQRLASKKKESSQVVMLESHDNTMAMINALIDAANARIAEHNKLVVNISKEKAALTKDVWRFIVEELKADISSYMGVKARLTDMIEELNAQIKVARENKAAKEEAIRELEKQTTSVQPTVDAMNSLLSSAGFHGFALARAADGDSNVYRIIRPDGVDAKATLSEGEKSFVAFLYFYHLLKGSESGSGPTVDRIVVFDDPVSGLDSEMLSVVANLIRGLFDEVRNGKGYIKQGFVLTHSIQFHQAVAFREGITAHDEAFWIVRRPESDSIVERQARI